MHRTKTAHLCQLQASCQQPQCSPMGLLAAASRGATNKGGHRASGVCECHLFSSTAGCQQVRHPATLKQSDTAVVCSSNQGATKWHKRYVKHTGLDSMRRQLSMCVSSAAQQVGRLQTHFSTRAQVAQHAQPHALVLP